MTWSCHRLYLDFDMVGTNWNKFKIPKVPELTSTKKQLRPFSCDNCAYTFTSQYNKDRHNQFYCKKIPKKTEETPVVEKKKKKDTQTQTTESTPPTKEIDPFVKFFLNGDVEEMKRKLGEENEVPQAKMMKIELPNETYGYLVIPCEISIK